MSIPMWRPLSWLVAVALILLPVVAVFKGWIGNERWPLNTVRIEPAPGQITLERADPARIQRALQPFAAQGYFAIDLDAARRALLATPWVKSAQLRRYWPDILDIQISEHRPFARWGEDQVLSEQGGLFPADNILLPDGLPWLDGPVARTTEVVSLYDQARSLFAPAGFEVERLRLDARGSWRLTLSSGTEVILGSRDSQRRLSRFARMLPGLLAQHPTPLERADLRYSNGFALTWMQTPSHPAHPPSST